MYEMFLFVFMYEVFLFVFMYEVFLFVFMYEVFLFHLPLAQNVGRCGAKSVVDQLWWFCVPWSI